MSKSSKKIIKRFLWTLSLLTVLIVLSGVSLAYIYEDEVKQYAIEKINEHTKSKIKVDKIELSFLKRFPMAALQFHQVKIMEVVKSGQAGILLKADDIYLKFNVIDLVNKKIIIKDIEIDQAKLNLVVFEDGTDNFHIFKAGDKQESEMVLEFFKISLNNSEVLYHNYASKQDLDLSIDKIVMAGNFAENTFNIDFEGNTIIRKYSSEGFKMFENKSLEMNVNIAINPKTKLFDIKTGNIVYNKIPLSIAGNISIPKEGVLLDLVLNAPSISVSQLLTTLPNNFKPQLRDYQITGVLGITAYIKGLIVSRSVPNLKVDVSLKNGAIKNTNFDTRLQNINIKASYTNGKNHALSSSSIQVKNMSFVMGASKFDVKFLLTNFVNSRLKMELNSNLDLGELIKFTGKLYGIQKLSGKADLKLKIAGNISGVVGDKKLELAGLEYKAQLKMQGANFQHQSSGVYYQDIEGEMTIDAKSIEVLPTWVTINGNRQQLSGSIRNYAAWNKDPSQNKLHIRAKTSISKLSYNDIQQIISSNEEGDGSFPSDIDMVLYFQADSFLWENMIARNAKGVFSLRNQIMSFENTSFQAFGGGLNSDISINGISPSKHPIVCKGNMNNIDINKLFIDFHNFDQEVITDKNIKGRLTTQFMFNANFDKNWSIESKSIVLESDVVIDNGELINIKELDALSKYTRIDDFSHIKFSSLKNSIQIKDRKLMIPDMVVQSNKMNLDLAGTHDFDNNYDYHIGVLMSDVLFKKAKAKSENEFGEVQSDGYGRTKLFFHVFGKGDDLHVKYDRVSMAKKIKKDMKDEGDDLKTTLNKEFGWFKKSQEESKKDSLKTQKEKQKANEKETLKKQEEGEFIFEWDEGEEEEQEPPQIP